MLTPSQLESLNKLIDTKVYGFIAQNITTDQLTPEQVKVLKGAGVQVDKILPKDLLIHQSFALGIISGAIPKSTLNAANYEAFKKYLGSTKMIPLNSYEKAVISSLERQSLSDIVGIGNKYKKTLEGAVISSERKYYEDTIRNNIEEGRAKKESLRAISNNISKELDDFGRSFDKAVQFISHQAFTEGRTAFFERNYGDQAEIYFEVYDGACTVCVKSYTTAGIGSEPIIFKNRELPPPNVNFGVKVKEQVVTEAPRHPYCRLTNKSSPKVMFGMLRISNLKHQKTLSEKWNGNQKLKSNLEIKNMKRKSTRSQKRWLIKFIGMCFLIITLTMTVFAYLATLIIS